MTTTISPDQYCKNPQAYKNTPGIDNQTKLYWSNYCRLKKEMNNQKMPSHTSFGQAIPEAIERFLLAIVSPKGLEMMGIIMGGSIVYKSAKTAIGKLIKYGLDEESLKIAEDFIAKGGSEVIANGGILTKALFSDMAFVDIKVAEEIGYSGGKYAASFLFDLLGDFLDGFNKALLVLQILSMIFDAWDPCDLNLMLDNKQLALFTRNFNAQFRSSLLANLESTKDSYGHTIVSADWPLQYYAERSALIPFKNKYYDNIKMNLMFSYLNSLQFNSCGLPMNYQKGGKGKLVTNDIIKGLNLDLFVYFSDDNTVVINWMAKWWPILLGVFLLLFVLFLVARSRRNNK